MLNLFRIVGIALAAAGAALLIRSLARAFGKRAREYRLANHAVEEYLFDEGEVSAPVGPGLVGKAKVEKNGVVVEVAVRASDPAQAFARGTRVRVIDCLDQCYVVEPSEEEHQVR